MAGTLLRRGDRDGVVIQFTLRALRAEIALCLPDSNPRLLSPEAVQQVGLDRGAPGTVIECVERSASFRGALDLWHQDLQSEAGNIGRAHGVREDRNDVSTEGHPLALGTTHHKLTGQRIRIT
ncbi:MAG: hypothetical protein AAGD11_21120 [Planctomycetota bacterium]